MMKRYLPENFRRTTVQYGCKIKAVAKNCKDVVGTTRFVCTEYIRQHLSANSANLLKL